MKTSIPSKITEGQEIKYRRLVEDSAKHATDLALGKTEADQDGWQRVLENGDELRDAIAEVVVAKTKELSVSNQFADEEVKSSYGYLSGYSKPKGITEQTNRLRELIPGIGFANEELVKQPLPANAEGYFAIPRWQNIAPTYGEALQKVLNLIKQTRDGKFYNYREGNLGPQYLRQHAKNVKAFGKLGNEQKNYDILVVACQFGKLHAGKSVRRAREVMSSYQFGLDPFAIACMLLTHPERLQHYDDLWIDCAGSEYSVGGGGQFGGASCFEFCGGGAKFNTSWGSSVRGYYGSASAFLLPPEVSP